MLPELSPELKIGIVGLGYVGLPLALAFAEDYQVLTSMTVESRLCARALTIPCR